MEAYKACSKSSINCFLSVIGDSPVTCGPFKALEASTLSAFMAERHLEKTASPIKVTGIPKSRALTAVHLPVPF